MSNQDYTHAPLPNEPCLADPPPSSDAADTTSCPDPALGVENEKLDDHNPNLEAGEKAKLPGLCHHRMESGYYCQSPALRDRRYCYSHLRLRGQRIRMARAIARRLPYRFELPALDDLYAVQAAVEHVARALAAGLMKREEATGLLWALQQSAINHRNLAVLQMTAGAPPLSPSLGDRACPEPAEGVDDQKRPVEEYPEFEAEFGLAAGMDVSQPAHVLFPPPEDQWRVPTPARDPKTSPWCHRQPGKHWTREEIEREELEKKARTIGEHAYLREVNQLNERVARQLRKHQEAGWQAEADRRNAALEEGERQFGSMNEGERQAYNLGIVRAMEAVEEQAEEQEKWKKQVATAAAAS